MTTWPKQSLTEEEVEDIVGKMAAYGLEYDDANGLLKRTREGPNPYDVAKTFKESDVTLSAPNSEVKNKSVQLLTDSPTGNITSRDPDDSTYSASAWRGLVINPDTDLEGVKVTLSANTGSCNSIRVADSNGNKLNEESISASGGDSVEILADMASGSDYHVQVYTSGGSAGYDGNPSFPYSGTDLDLVTGSYGSYSTGSSNAWTFIDVEGLVSTTSESGYVEWPADRVMSDWDTATFTKTLDGATADIFVAYNDGSGWTRTNGGNPISRNYSLGDDSNISASDNVRIEFELSRPDDTYNPTLDSAFLSWFV